MCVRLPVARSRSSSRICYKSRIRRTLFDVLDRSRTSRIPRRLLGCSGSIGNAPNSRSSLVGICSSICIARIARRDSLGPRRCSRRNSRCRRAPSLCMWCKCIAVGAHFVTNLCYRSRRFLVLPAPSLLGLIAVLENLVCRCSSNCFVRTARTCSPSPRR